MSGGIGPTIPLVTELGVAQVREPTFPLAEFLRARDEVLAGVALALRAPGRPPRNSYLVAEIAYENDLCRFDPVRLDAAAYVAREYLDWQDGARRRLVFHWARAGRRVLFQLGAWPWALAPAPDGRLGRAWWEDPHYWRALDAWGSATTIS